ncbi:ASCH domain-containing protein [Streptomyces sp. NPDC088553]|uniref:ASCH domain-containing protein n=1 Tax=Streptomyces sp. NPDC088553 TaxID=3365864 RepID=UPI003821F1B1
MLFRKARRTTWEHAAAEGEGDADLDAWRAVHRRFWSGAGSTPVEDDTLVVCLAFRAAGRPAGAAFPA